MNYYWKRLIETASELGLEREDLSEFSPLHNARRHTAIFREPSLNNDILTVTLIDSYTFESEFEQACQKGLQTLREYASWK